MKDYERNFYMPFKGVRKPIYAIPGNHDWFNATEAFNANLLSPDAARAAISARIDEDHWTHIDDGAAQERHDRRSSPPA